MALDVGKKKKRDGKKLGERYFFCAPVLGFKLVYAILASI